MVFVYAVCAALYDTVAVHTVRKEVAQLVNYRENTAGLFLTPSQDAALHERFGYRFVKRCFDITVSLLMLAVLLVPMLVIAAVVSCDSKGGAVFRQKRIGMDGKEFYIYKFRTMYTSAPGEVATSSLTDSGEYITRVGAFLRRTSVDELPQLVNILKGDMSFVGPRPLIRGETDIHDLREAAGVYSVRPGMTGWAQINGRDEVSIERKVELDAEYVERCSVLFDARILADTVRVVLHGDGYAEGGSNH